LPCRSPAPPPGRAAATFMTRRSGKGGGERGLAPAVSHLCRRRSESLASTLRARFPGRDGSGASATGQAVAARGMRRRHPGRCDRAYVGLWAVVLEVGGIR
jgi:hypothetical protein